jgi:[FeFe] hydrogenase (group B1/B3)
MGLSLTKEHAKKRLSTMARHSLTHSHDYSPCQLEVIDIACDNCPIDKFFITNACRNCLSHACQQSCKREAIQIVGNQAYIDQSRCVECGMCLKACKYGAIIEVHRPCEAACSIKAIKADQQRKANIDSDKCVNCGNCMISCPFGAISDRSQMIRVINWLKGPEPTIALVAPAIIGQMGQKDKLGPVFQALQQIGFDRVAETAFGADMVAMAESAEFAKVVPADQPYLLTSCCPAFVKLVKEHAAPQYSCVSSTVSPMVVAAQALKKEEPAAKIVFLGPCIAKKQEAMESGVVDAVLTFEELAALFVAADVNIANLETQPEVQAQGSADGQGFAAAGGVKAAMEKGLENHPGIDFRGKTAQGLQECLDDLKLLAKGDTTFNFLEGMACSGGCLGGPGALLDFRKSKRFLEQRGATLPCDNLCDNQAAADMLEVIAEKLHVTKS